MSSDEIKYDGIVWLIDNNNPKPLLDHSIEKLIKYGVKKDDIKITDAPERNPNVRTAPPRGANIEYSILRCIILELTAAPTNAAIAAAIEDANNI